MSLQQVIAVFTIDIN